ncbi:MAG: hypothetical protein HFE75_07875 [Firmicutes bacterium]|nr:hypothetical protein [Bacillota bacterium]
MTKMLKDGESSERHGELGNFVVRVHHKQHSSWQGFVTHLEKNETVSFRSVLELLKIIDGILNDEEKRGTENI